MAQKPKKKTAKKPAKKPAKKSAKRPAVKAKKKAAKKPTQKPVNIWYGLIVNGSRIPMSLPSIADAQESASGLKEQGCEVAVYDQDTGNIVKRL
jgi:hypothetical protein